MTKERTMITKHYTKN